MNYIKILGKIEFDPINRTKKHSKQSSWKKMAMIIFEGDVAEYYSYFIFKRYGLKLNRPLRNSHISFINDSYNDIKKGSQLISDNDVDILWNNVKKKWNNQKIEVTLNISPETNGEHWWLKIPHKERKIIDSIRNELYLDKPYFGYHLSIGYAANINLKHSQYIHQLLLNGLIN